MIVETVFPLVLHDEIFYFEPGTYEDIEALWAAEEHEEMQEGTWVFTQEVYWYDPATDNDILLGVATVEITRNADGTNSILTYAIDLAYHESDDVDHYEGQIIVTDSNWETLKDGESYKDGDIYDNNLDFEINFELANSAEGSLAGNVDLNLTWYEEYDVLNSMTGNIDGNFTCVNGEYAFAGEASLRFNSAQADYFRGTIHLPDADFTGELALSYVSNPWLENKPLFEFVNCRLLPNRLTLTGSLTDKDPESKLSVDGTLSLELKNAAQFDFTGRYSPMNWPGIKLNFNGNWVSQDNDRMAGELNFEEVAWNRIDANISYTLTLMDDPSIGTTRRINLTAKSSDESKMDIQITSDWGQAAIDMHIEFNPQLFYYWNNEEFAMGEPSVSGQISVQGEKVGVLTQTDWGIRIDYDDGTFDYL